MTDTDTAADETTEQTDAAEEVEQTDPETFDRAYVEKLREEAAGYRVKAKRADDLARELFHHRVTALGKLADPSDLPYDEQLLDDGAALAVAVDELILRKPHLADRRPRGDVDQGARSTEQTVDLAGILRTRAG